jgi:hypothetical protein
MWWPAWILNARVLASWTADSEVGAVRAAWAPHSGQAMLMLRDIVVSASRGLTQDECRELAPVYDLTRAGAEPRGPEGAQVECYGIARSGARRAIAQAVQDRARAGITQEIPGKRHRNIKVATLISGLETSRWALPAYVLAYRYRGKLFRVVLHGQDAERFLGKMPYSGWRIAGAVVGGAALIAGVIALIVFLAGRAGLGATRPPPSAIRPGARGPRPRPRRGPAAGSDRPRVLAGR